MTSPASGSPVPRRRHADSAAPGSPVDDQPPPGPPSADSPASGVPVASRLYVVLTRVPRRTSLAVGSLGTVTFQRGWYAYVGSALRGRDARVARHLAREKPLRWHADYLFRAFPPQRAWLVDGAAGECELAGALAAAPAAERRPRRFGAGDCRCTGHLVRLPRRPLRRDIASAAHAAGAPMQGSVRTFQPPGSAPPGHSSVSLRPVAPADLPNIARWADFVAGYQSRMRPLDESADRHDPGAGLFWYVVVEDGADAGTVWIELPAGGEEAVLGVFLAGPSFFGRGIGTCALGLALVEFRAAHPHRPLVLRVRCSNTRAIACYRRAGLRLAGPGSKAVPTGGEIPIFRMILPPRP